ncbi:4'-phosphopantetheinyl transferase family protein [Streptomyces sp. 4N509B]|uniref:4'-phosphopantetheinyl transferase family protein n=1 Tax=Streptomyces sp. 4N509B TaxID=3457413 RepID=UPI003FD4C4DE
MIKELLPPEVAAEDVFGAQPVQPGDLFPEEEAHVARAVDKRRREFCTVRVLARTALARLDGPRVPLMPGERGAPGWPEGFVGSMTHTTGYCAAVVARRTELASVGIDAEPNEPLRESGVLNMISLPVERPRLEALAARRPEVCWPRLLFSAKESVYKAWYPLARRFLDFDEADIVLREDGTFHARLLVEGPELNGRRVDGFSGRWMSRGGILVSAIAVPHRPVSA